MPFNEVTFGLETSDVVGFTPDQRTAIELQLCVSIFSEGPAVYKNFRYPRYRNFYGYAQIMSGVHVVKKVAIRYLNQEILHWRDISFGINDTTGCYFKGYGAADSPPIVVVPNTVKTRQRYTSVRFRFVEGVLANCDLVWETAQSKCDSNILEPPNEQGKPPAGNNGGYNPGQRPEGQTGDPEDPSANDGNYNPSDGLPPPPSPGAGTGQWYEIISHAINTQCEERTDTYILPGATDGTIVPVWVPGPDNQNCPQTKDGAVYYGITAVDSPVAVSSISFFFVPAGGGGGI